MLQLTNEQKIKRTYSRGLYAYLIIPLLLSTLFSPAYAGCNINIKIYNNETAPIYVDWYFSKVKSKGGSWKRISSSGKTIAPGESLSKVYFATFGCSAKRRYKLYFRTVPMTNSWVEYFPSPSAWTSKPNIFIHAKR